MKGSRQTWLGGAALAAACALTVSFVAWRTYDCPRTLPYDDHLWYARAVVLPYRAATPAEYYLDIDVPGLYRWTTGLTLRALGMADYRLPPPEPGRSASWNAVNRFRLPPRIILAMRTANLAMSLAGFFLLWLVAGEIIGSRRLALAAVLPLVISPAYTIEVMPRIGPDALLFLMLSATLYAWRRLHARGRGASAGAVIAVGVLAGLAASAKLNGALAALAFAAYLAANSRGRLRLANPAAALAVAFLTFVAVNPVVVASGHAPWTVVADMLRRREVVAAAINGNQGTLPTLTLLNAAFPLWPLLPVMAGVLYLSRREAWFAPLFWWGLFLFAGTWFTINHVLPRYLAPLQLGAWYTTIVCLLALLSKRLSRPMTDPHTP